MQKQQVFKVKGMQRDASMANANGEFAYEILNMRLMPTEDLSGFSLTNEKGTLTTGITLQGQVIGQCPTNDSLVVFAVSIEFSIQGSHQTDYIYEIWEGQGEDITAEDWNEVKWRSKILYSGNLNFNTNYPIEALFNYETEDIQKVYWIDGLNQLRCINLVGEIKQNNDQQFDSIKEINSLPSLEIERVAGGSFTAGVIQYYVTYFNKNLSESPIVYTSPLLYIAHDNRGANVNDQVSTAFKLTFTDLDTTNWEYMRIYATHRTSIDATPEASIVTELNMNSSTIEFTDYGSNRTSIAPTDLYFTGGKFIKAGTMTVKDQVMFLGNLNIETPETVSVVDIQHLFDSIRDNEDHPFTTTTRKTKENKLEEYEGTHYYYKNQLNNTESITHYKYGEKYRFGISVLDKYGNWSNPIWIKDAFIEVPPEQVDSNTLELPCPSLNLFYSLTYNNETKTLLEHLQDRGVISIKPIVVFPKEEERKVIAQGVVCPTVYNLKDRKENGPYAQASWFMRPNAPVDLWGILEDPVNLTVNVENYNEENKTQSITINHYSDLIDSNFSGNHSEDNRAYFGYFGINEDRICPRKPITNYQLMIDDGIPYDRQISGDVIFYPYSQDSIAGAPRRRFDPISLNDQFYDNVVRHGSWVEFRHNYALRSKGWSFGSIMGGYENELWKGQMFGFGKQDKGDNQEIKDSRIFGSFRCAEIGSTRYHHMLPVNRLWRNSLDNLLYFRNIGESGWDVDSNFITGNSAYYIDSSIVTLNSPEFELSENLYQATLEDTNFRVIGLIPLTATVSDMSLEISNPASNPDSLDVGLHVVHTTNKNIGHHGFKGIVSANSYFSNPKSANHGYRTVLLNPWHTTGTIQAVSDSSTGFGDSELLKRKVLSNLRYSASSFYLPSDRLSLIQTANEEQANEAWLNDNVIAGWKPANGISISMWTNKEDTSIIKLLNGKTNTDLVYRGNIDVIATATYGEDVPATIYPAARPDTNTNAYDQSTFYSHTDWGYEGKGASIKYKSSPHAVIAFKEFSKDELWGHDKKYTQEILPAFAKVNTVGLPAKYSNDDIGEDVLGELYEDPLFNSIPHQSQLSLFTSILNDPPHFGLPSYYAYTNNYSPAYGWLWLGEIYRETDPTFGGTSDYALQNNQWENGGGEGFAELWEGFTFSKNLLYTTETLTEFNESELPGSVRGFGRIDISTSGKHTLFPAFYFFSGTNFIDKSIGWDYIEYTIQILEESDIHNQIVDFLYNEIVNDSQYLPGSGQTFSGEALLDSLDSTTTYIHICRSAEDGTPEIIFDIPLEDIEYITIGNSDSIYAYDIQIGFRLEGNIPVSTVFKNIFYKSDITIPVKPESKIYWTQGDTYYQRFDTLKTYAYSDSDQNSVIDITSFMVETRINIDGRTDRNRGQESNLQISPTNFNLMNDVYSQRDNFFTYRILDEDLQARTNFPNQITWSLTKTAGATVDAWMNITLASVLDLDGTKGELTALKNFNNNIIAFQEKGLSHIMFNSRAQIATSEAVPIQIANTGKVDGQQYFTTDVGCQDKWNIVTTPNGLYFVDYFNKSIYRFNGQLEDISTPNGFRSWCYENLNSTTNIIGYYDVKNKEVMYYIGDTGFTLDNSAPPGWLGFSELTGAFSSFYTYPKAWFANVQDQGLWLLSGDTGTTVFTHQTGNYNQLLGLTSSKYGLTVIPRQDSNTVKTFNNVEFRADFYNGSTLDDNHHFDTISAETEYQDRTPAPLTYDKYIPSNLKKKFRTWRANIPRVNNGYNRFVNQWAKIGLWKMNPSTEKTILHDLSVWYSE